MIDQEEFKEKISRNKDLFEEKTHAAFYYFEKRSKLISGVISLSKNLYKDDYFFMKNLSHSNFNQVMEEKEIKMVHVDNIVSLDHDDHLYHGVIENFRFNKTNLKYFVDSEKDLKKIMNLYDRFFSSEKGYEFLFQSLSSEITSHLPMLICDEDHYFIYAEGRHRIALLKILIKLGMIESSKAFIKSQVYSYYFSLKDLEDIYDFLKKIDRKILPVLTFKRIEKEIICQSYFDVLGVNKISFKSDVFFDLLFQ